MESKNYLRIMKVTEKGTGRPFEIPENEISMLGAFEEEKPLNDFLADGEIKYGCWRLQLKSGMDYHVCGEFSEYIKGVRYLVHAKGNGYDETRKKR